MYEPQMNMLAGRSVFELRPAAVFLYNALSLGVHDEAEQCFGRERRSGSPRKKGNCVGSETRLFSTIELAARCGAMAIASAWLEDSCTEK